MADNDHESDLPPSDEGGERERLDEPAGVEASSSGVGPGDRPLTVRAHVRDVAAKRARALAAAQGRALRALLAALAERTDKEEGR